MLPSNKKSAPAATATPNIFNAVAVVVLAAIVLLPLPEVITTTHRIVETADLTQIAKGYDSFRHATNPPRLLSVDPGSTAQAAAFLLARDTGLYDPSIWMLKWDPRLSGVTKPSSVVSIDSNVISLNSDFSHTPLSFEIAANIPLDAPPNTTPVAWTRGLQADGTWAPDSPWKGTGGHVAFLDGHVDWDDKLSTDTNGNTLYKYGTNTPTTNIHEALPPGAVVLSADPTGK